MAGQTRSSIPLALPTCIAELAPKGKSSRASHGGAPAHVGPGGGSVAPGHAASWPPPTRGSRERAMEPSITSGAASATLRFAMKRESATTIMQDVSRFTNMSLSGVSRPGACQLPLELALASRYPGLTAHDLPHIYLLRKKQMRAPTVPRAMPLFRAVCRPFRWPHRRLPQQPYAFSTICPSSTYA